MCKDTQIFILSFYSMRAQVLVMKGLLKGILIADDFFLRNVTSELTPQ